METLTKTKRKRVIFDSQVYTGFQICEEYMNLHYNHRFVPISGPGRGIEMGAMMHVLLEAFYKAKKAGKDKVNSTQLALSSGELFITGCNLCKAEICEVHRNPIPGLQSITLDQAHEVINTFLAYLERWKNDSWTTVAVEHVLGDVVYEDENISIMWKAKVDWLVDNLEGIFSVDHKTMSRQEETISLNNQFIGQAILTKQSKIFVNKIGYQTSLKPEDKFVRVAINYTKERMLEWITELVSYAYDYITCVESEQYRHRFTSCSRKYGDCLYRKVCEGQPRDRERLIREQFKVGRRWDILND